MECQHVQRNLENLMDIVKCLEVNVNELMRIWEIRNDSKTIAMRLSVRRHEHMKVCNSWRYYHILEP